MAGQGLGCAILVVAAGIAGLVPNRSAIGEEVKTTPVRVGLTGSLFRDTPEGLVHTMMRPFKSLMESQTGLSGELVPGIKSDELGQRLKDDKLQLAVYQGFEFAWAREKLPQLRPLMIAVNQQKELRAFVVVRDDGAAKLADLKGKTIAVPRRTREHCHLFLERRCEALGHEPKEFFAKVLAPFSAEEAVDAVVNGQVDAALADGCFLSWYEKHKAARYARLKLLEKSEVFPATVVAYYAEALDEATLRRFRDGMLSAKDNPRGVQLMTLCQMTSFEPVPDDYDKVCKEIARAYPPPGKKKDDK
ncbi:MAG TPA: PhnD/SsuA/transferrin family substrate-binding protein [Gemmataceae bacterium]|nr:PhnD/SsuA/transferrin family substrate-binding protein [Gemmataceae bacterium]